MVTCYNYTLAGSSLLVILESKHNKVGHSIYIYIYTLIGREISTNGRNVKRMQCSGENI